MAYDQIRVGMIGTGRISDLHAIEYCNNRYATIVGLCDPDIAKAHDRAAAWGLPDARVTADYHELLADERINLVEVLVPHHLHAPIALAAFGAGKAVSLQKPMCLTVAEADQLIDAAADAKVPFKVFENFIFYPPVSKAKALIDDGAIGDPLTIRLKSHQGVSDSAWHVPNSARAWRQDVGQSGGGPLTFDDGHHKFALAWHFMGQAETVHAWIGETIDDRGLLHDAPSMISFRFPGNRVGNLEIAYSKAMPIETRHYAQDDRVEITGTKGVIWINRGHGQIGNPAPVVLYRDGIITEYTDVETGWETSFVHSTRHTIEALRHGRPLVLTGTQGREVLRFAVAAQASAQRGEAVSVESIV